MNRRHFILAAAGTAAASYDFSAAAQPASLPRIGYLSGRSLGSDGLLLQAFRDGLKTTGYVDGQNVVIDARWADGKFDQVPALAADLLARKPVLICAVGGNPVATAVKAATSTVPVLFAVGSDAVELGLVKSLDRPDANLTGVMLGSPELDVKKLDLLRELVPQARRIALFTNPQNALAVREQQAIQAEGTKLGMTIEVFDGSRSAAIEKAFDKLQPGQVDALVFVDDPFLISRRDRIIAFASLRRLPAVYPSRVFPDTGGLASYGTRWSDMYFVLGGYAGRILRGDKPANLPVQRPTQYELVVNQRTARALGLTVPPAVLGRGEILN
jgi:putative ABC transport system substrate-binding protein